MHPSVFQSARIDHICDLTSDVLDVKDTSTCMFVQCTNCVMRYTKPKHELSGTIPGDFTFSRMYVMSDDTVVMSDLNGDASMKLTFESPRCSVSHHQVRVVASNNGVLYAWNDIECTYHTWTVKGLSPPLQTYFDDDTSERTTEYLIEEAPYRTRFLFYGPVMMYILSSCGKRITFFQKDGTIAKDRDGKNLYISTCQVPISYHFLDPWRCVFVFFSKIIRCDFSKTADKFAEYFPWDMGVTDCCRFDKSFMYVIHGTDNDDIYDSMMTVVDLTTMKPKRRFQFPYTAIQVTKEHAIVCHDDDNKLLLIHPFRKKWSVHSHRLYPDEFKSIVQEIVRCSYSSGVHGDMITEIVGQLANFLYPVVRTSKELTCHT